MESKLPDALVQAISARSRLTGDFILRSGRTSNEYFDKYLFESDPKLIKEVADRMAALVLADAQMLGGLELGGVPLATLVGQTTGLPVLFVRKEAKQYGTRRLAEGGDPAGKRIVLIEDVVTSGGAVLDAAAAIRGLGGTVTDVVCAIDRQESGREALAAAGLTLHSVLTRSDLNR
ncbi:orotate phosphoribosyltransferase [Candidatus Saccharibacteria bacterium]|nr:orotate phosphoribosyltransferase [Candidatus Saccharibacteria bacterium]